MGNKIPAAAPGATGGVGQEFIRLLENHPWFVVRVMAASEEPSAVEDGHLESVSVKLEGKTTRADIAEALRLPSAPSRPVFVPAAQDCPQPRFDANHSGGMSTLVGRIRARSVLDFRFTALGHNTVRGASGASIPNAGLLKSQGLLD